MVTTRELVIDKPGTYLGVRKGLFVVRGADGSRAEFSPAELSHEPISVRFVLVQHSRVCYSSSPPPRTAYRVR
jgi:hypothetical protein